MDHESIIANLSSNISGLWIACPCRDQGAFMASILVSAALLSDSISIVVWQRSHSVGEGTAVAGRMIKAQTRIGCVRDYPGHRVIAARAPLLPRNAKRYWGTRKVPV